MARTGKITIAKCPNNPTFRGPLGSAALKQFHYDESYGRYGL